MRDSLGAGAPESSSAETIPYKSLGEIARAHGNDASAQRTTVPEKGNLEERKRREEVERVKTQAVGAGMQTAIAKSPLDRRTQVSPAAGVDEGFCRWRTDNDDNDYGPFQRKKRRTISLQNFSTRRHTQTRACPCLAIRPDRGPNGTGKYPQRPGKVTETFPSFKIWWDCLVGWWKISPSSESSVRPSPTNRGPVLKLTLCTDDSGGLEP